MENVLARKHKIFDISLSFPSLVFSLIIFSRKSFATDMLTPSAGLVVGQTLVSSGQTFELGFFIPGNSSKQYIGIWYKNIASNKIVWVANRENPLRASDTASSLRIAKDGNLILVDGRNITVWSTNITSKINNTIALLSGNGDFYLKDNISGSTLWESFDYPGNTAIPGMKIGANKMTGENYIQTSWKTQDNPSRGIFSTALTTETPPQTIVWKSSKPYWRSGPWDGLKFIGTPNTGIGYSNGIIVTVDNQQGSAYVTYNPPDISHVAIVSLEPDGNLLRSHWNLATQLGGVTWRAIVVFCDVYGTCGPYGVCNREGSRSCECLKGFVPKSMDEWAKGNWTSGCVRRTKSLCEKSKSEFATKEAKEDGFLKIGLIKLPDNFVYLFKLSSLDCREWCLKNCSCEAYAFPAGIGCMVWDVGLVDTQLFSSGGADLFLRLASSELGEEKKSIKIIIMLTMILGVILLGVFLFVLRRWRSNRRVDKKGTMQLLEPEKESSDIPMIDFNKLVVATDNFSELKKLGFGGFGPVYKGRLENGKDIAVKRLSVHSGQGGEEFKNEILLISKLQHRNLVRLLGYCNQGEEKLLIYEYLKNKSLDTWLFDSKIAKLLGWAKRLNIIHGIARGLLYLHRDSHLRIIHRDLKASNILLDDNLNPRISDFGLARAFQITQELANTNRVVGTLGYISPEYAMGGLLSEKSDVYSFGILLLEIISGMRNSTFFDDGKYNLLCYAWHLWKEERPLELMDKALSSSCTDADFMQCMHIGLLCVQDHAGDRPTMSTVVLMLGSETDLPQPKEPMFYQSILGVGLTSGSTSKFSTTDTTKSEPEEIIKAL